MHEHHEQIRKQIFERRLEAFLKEWQPEDHYMAMEFHRDLHMLVRDIYDGAQAPILKHLTEVMKAWPIAPFLKT